MRTRYQFMTLWLKLNFVYNLQVEIIHKKAPEGTCKRDQYLKWIDFEPGNFSAMLLNLLY